MTDPHRIGERPEGPPTEPFRERRRYKPGQRPDEPRERRRPGWAEFRQAYPGILAVAGVAVLVLIGLDMWMIAKRMRYEREIERLRAEMTAAQRERADVAIAANENKVRVMVELLRRQARLDEALHLSVAVDSGTMVLEREGAVLRVIPADIGPERWLATGGDSVLIATPLGKRTIQRVLTGDDAWEVPAWVYQDRGLSVPADRAVRGALGSAALILDGGTVVYAMPSVGPLADTGYVLPGSIRVRPADLEAVLPNLGPGMAVYFY